MSWLSDVNSDIRAGLLRAVPGPVWDWMWRRRRKRQDRIDEEMAVRLSYYSREELGIIIDGACFGPPSPHRETVLRQAHMALRLKKERWKHTIEEGES